MKVTVKKVKDNYFSSKNRTIYHLNSINFKIKAIQV